MKRIKKFLFLGSILFIALIFIAYPFRRQMKHKVKALLGYSTGVGGGGGSGSCPTYPEIFTDNVKTHKLAYSDDGIKPQKDDDELDKLSISGKLSKLQTDSLYIVRKTRFSRPYITPKGHSFIKELSKSYYKRCVMDSIRYVPFTISSLTRSKKSVEKLMSNNSNAIKNSSHLRGKTFDISYRAFNNNVKQTQAFISVLQELRNQNKCFVKYERNGYLHITVI